MRYIIYLMISIIFISCNDGNVETKAIARVNNKYLYKEDLLGKMPEDLTMEDSVLFRSNFINSWAMEQLLLQKAELNIGDENEEKLIFFNVIFLFVIGLFLFFFIWSSIT